MRTSIVVVLAAVAAGCPAPNTSCGPSNCRGCCSADGTCQTGFDDLACGVNGTGCSDCQALNASCTSTHACLIGGAGGGSGGAGGSAGGTVVGPGINEKQLISGTRLKAVRFISGDGAQAPYSSVFWDTQLSIACSPASSAYAFASYYQLFLQQDVGTGRCYPSLLANDFGLGALYGQHYSDPACNQPVTFGLNSFYAQYFGRASGPPSPMNIFSPSNVKYGLRTDGGIGAYTGQVTRATLYTGPLYARYSGDGGCAFTPRDGGFDYYTLGADVPETEFAAMTVAIDP